MIFFSWTPTELFNIPQRKTMEFSSTFPDLHKINHTVLFPSCFICVFGYLTSTTITANIHEFSKSKHGMDIICVLQMFEVIREKTTTHSKRSIYAQHNEMDRHLLSLSPFILWMHRSVWTITQWQIKNNVKDMSSQFYESRMKFWLVFFF